jgi:3-dehydroquinate synthase
MTTLDQLDWESILDLSIPVKLRAVAQDPRDHGARKALNFGHTIGHALESYYLTAGTPVSHGIAVALGMMAESKLALDQGLLRVTDFEQVINLIDRLVKPTIEYIPTGAQLAGWMQHDKKVISGATSFSLPDGIANCRWDVKGLDPSAAIGWLQEHVSTQSMRLMND